MWVVKLGGSLSRDTLLPAWLELLARDGAGRVVVVPGGGEFAEAARAAQLHWQFGDLPAHNMAILGMCQFALVLQGLAPALELAADERSLRLALAGGKTALWMPLDLLRREADDLTNWEVSSDSLSLWLADRLEAQAVVLVKSCPIPSAASWEGLAGAGIVDRAFPARAGAARYPITLLERGEIARMRERLTQRVRATGENSAS